MRNRHKQIYSNSSAGILSFQVRTRFFWTVLLCSVALGCKSQDLLHIPQNITPASSAYKTEIFNLVEPDGDQYGTAIGQAVSAAFDHFLKLSGQDVQMLRERLLSGPATEGSLWKVGNSHEWLYHICQANQSNVTNVALFYDEVSHRMAGRLLYRCALQWLGNPGDAEKALIENEYPIRIGADDARIFCRKG